MNIWEVCLPDQSGKEICLSDFKGRWIILYFYPKDNTPGCTREAISFSSLLPEFEKLNSVVIGVSRDSCKSHSMFASKFNLRHILLSDENLLLHKMFSVLKEVEKEGKKRVTIIRSTFLISPEGKVVKEWRNVRVDGHAEEVLAFLKSLQK